MKKPLLSRFPGYCQERSIKWIFTDRLEVVIPAVCREVGEIHVWIDGDEVTVGIGKLFHTHFETYLDDSKPKQEAEKEAVQNSLEFIKEFIDGELLLDINFEGFKAVTAYIRSREHDNRFSATIPIRSKGLLSRLLSWRMSTKTFTWKGPYR